MGLVFIGAAGAAFLGGRRYRWLNVVGVSILLLYLLLILLSISAGATTSS